MLDSVEADQAPLHRVAPRRRRLLPREVLLSAIPRTGMSPACDRALDRWLGLPSCIHTCELFGLTAHEWKNTVTGFHACVRCKTRPAYP